MPRVVCRRRADTDEREEPRPGLLGDGPTRRQYLPASCDDEEDKGDERDEYYYDDSEQHYDNDVSATGDERDDMQAVAHVTHSMYRLLFHTSAFTALSV